MHKAVVTVLGLGMAPFAPGTFGALGAFLMYAAFIYSGYNPGHAVQLIICLLATLIGTWSTSHVLDEWGEDPSRVVIDEFAGMCVTLCFVPLNLTNITIALILFRFFDILKPLGIRLIDKKLKGAWGVMLDDILAGIYACAVLHLYLYFTS